METPTTLIYEKTGRIARITLNRPERGNGITMAMPRELAIAVERANLDPEVHVIALAGAPNQSLALPVFGGRMSASPRAALAIASIVSSGRWSLITSTVPPSAE